MTRNRGRFLALSGFMISTALVASACAHNDASIVVHGVLAPPLPQNGECAYTSDPTQPEESSGVLDVALLASYTPEVLVGNQMIARNDNVNLKAETARVTLQGAVVHVDDTAGNEINSFTSLSSGFIDPAAGGVPSYGPMALTLIDPKTSAAMAGSLPASGTKQVVVHFTVFGQTAGGDDIESDEFQFPVNVCKGCLVSFPAGSSDPLQQPQPNCAAALGSNSASTTIIPCVVGQDQIVDCRLCQGNPACVP